MDYRTKVGEKVVRRDGVLGVITGVDSSGYIRIKYEGDFFEGSYMFDPFVSEHVKFVNLELQKIIDEAIKKNDENERRIIEKFRTDSKEDETYFITVASDKTPHHENGISDRIIGLNCSKEDAFKAFNYFITQQSRKMNKTGNRDDFHQVGLYDAKTLKKIAQES